MEYYKLASKQSKKAKTFTNAETNYKKAIELDSTNSSAYVGLGVLKMNSLNTNELGWARNYFTKAIVIDSTKADVWYFLAYTYIRESEIKKDTIDGNKLIIAISYLTKAISLNNKNSIYFYQKGYCYNYLGDTIKSNENFKISCNLGNFFACEFLNYHTQKE